MIKTAKEWFEEELSGEPLTQESVIEAIEMVQLDILSELILLLHLNEDDFDRGKGKYILKEFINEINDKINEKSWRYYIWWIKKYNNW